MFEEMKAYLEENEDLDGQFGYDDQYADYVNGVYGEAVEEASHEVGDDIFVEPSIQGGMGGVFMTCEKGSTNWDFESECDTLLDYAMEAETEEEFKNLIKGFILSKYEECVPEDDEDDEEDPDYEGCEEDDEDDEIDILYHDASEEELRKMGAFDNLNDEE